MAIKAAAASPTTTMKFLHGPPSNEYELLLCCQMRSIYLWQNGDCYGGDNHAKQGFTNNDTALLQLRTHV